MIGVSHRVPGDRTMIIVMRSEQEAREYLATVPGELCPKMVRVTLSPVEKHCSEKKKSALALWNEKRKR